MSPSVVGFYRGERVVDMFPKMFYFSLVFLVNIGHFGNFLVFTGGSEWTTYFIKYLIFSGLFGRIWYDCRVFKAICFFG